MREIAKIIAEYTEHCKDISNLICNRNHSIIENETDTKIQYHRDKMTLIANEMKVEHGIVFGNNEKR